MPFLLPKPDPQSFTRLLTSVGLFLCIVAFVGPALVLRETSVLRVSAKELAGLTPEARKELERRQEVSGQVGVAAPYGGGILLAAGLLLIGMAVPRLRKQEGADEARSSAELDKLRADLKPQDASDRQEALERELQEQATHQVDQPIPADEPVATPDGAGTTPQESAPAPAWDVRVSAEQMRAVGQTMRERQARQLEHERAVLDRISVLRPPHYELRTEVKLGNPSGGTLLLDGLFYSEIDQLSDVIIKVNVTTLLSFQPNLRRFADAALALGSRYAARADRSAVVWLVVVVDDDRTPSPRDREFLRQLARESPDTVISMVLRDQIDTLQLPRHLFG